MHDLSSIYKKVKRIIKSAGKEYFVHGDNSRFYPNQPVLSDVEVISLAITAEAAQIDSENLLWSKLKTDYPSLFKKLPHRTRFNQRRKKLYDLMINILGSVSDSIKLNDQYLIIDSMPLPTCKIVREKTSKACRNEKYDEVVATKGYSPMFNGYFIGYKFHLIISSSGVYKDLLITPAHVHDTAFLKELDKDDEHLKGYNLLGDRGYIGRNTQLRLFAELDLKLNIPYRKNQKDFRKYPFKFKIMRKKIETVFAQFCDEFMIRRNYAKRFAGFEIRLLTKVTCKSVKQYLNFKNGKPINQTKHSLAA